MFHCVSSQLLHPLGENSPIAGFLKKKADGGIHHICIEVRQLVNMVLSCGCFSLVFVAVVVL